MRRYFISLLIICTVLLSLGIMLYNDFGIKADKLPKNNYQLQILARCVNGEARGESYTGMVAVAAVVLNRVKHPSFPNTIVSVIYQPGAFTAVTNGQINVPIDPNSSIYKACLDAMNGWDPSGGALFYYNPKVTKNQWLFSRPVVATIGNHVFAK